MTKEELEIEVRRRLLSFSFLLSPSSHANFHRLVSVQRKSTPIISYWHPNVTLTIISDRSPISFSSPPEAKKHVQLEPSGQKSPDGTSLYHYPVVFPNDFWNLREHMTPINSTTPVLPIRISLSSISFWKFNLYSVRVSSLLLRSFDAFALN